MTAGIVRVPIESFIRDATPTDDATVVVRAGPITVEKFLEHMRRQQDRYSYRQGPMVSISVDATVARWTLEAILGDRLWSRSTYATATAGALRRAGYELLPTFDAPHFDVVVPVETTDAAGSLLLEFSPAERNPYRRRR